MTLSSVSSANPKWGANLSRLKQARQDLETLAQDSVSFTQQPPAQQPPAQQPPAQQPPAQQPPAQQPPPQQQPELKEWTVLVYSVSDNNLYSYMQTDLDEAERVGSTDEMNLVAETSHQPAGGNVVRMKMIADSSEGLTSPVVQDLGPNRDMAKASNLADTIAWAMKEYPSKHFMIIASDHGGGWKGAMSSDTTDSWLNVKDWEAGLKEAQELTGRKIDVLGFDACLMASAEVATQLQPYADYLVGSEETEGGAGWQYDETLNHKTSNHNSRVLAPQVLNYAAATLRQRGSLSPEEMAKSIVTMAEGHQQDLATMSAIDLNKMPAVTAALDNFAGAVLDGNHSKWDFFPVFLQTQKFAEFGDARHFVELAGKKFGGAIAEAATAVGAAMDEAVVAEQHSTSYPGAKGLNVELTRQKEALSNQLPHLEDPQRINFDSYADSKWAQTTRWDEMLNKVR